MWWVVWLLFSTLCAHASDAPPAPTNEARKTVRVSTKPFEPFVFRQNDKWIGFSLDLWREIAGVNGWEYELIHTDSVKELLDTVRAGEADFAVAGLTITAEREQTVDFSYAFYQSGLQILVPEQQQSTVRSLVGAMMSPALFQLVGLLFVLLLIAAHVIWVLERKANPDMFPDTYFEGVWEAFWWASVTLTTVGYGDKIPQGRPGRAVALMWMFSGIIVIAYFTASVTTVLTVQHLQGDISGPDDLRGKRVGTVKGTTASRWLYENAVTRIREYPDIHTAYDGLDLREVDCVIYDSPVLLYYAAHEGNGRVRTTGPIFANQAYGIAMPEDSPHREDVNRALLILQENGVYGETYARWFGGRP